MSRFSALFAGLMAGSAAAAPTTTTEASDPFAAMELSDTDRAALATEFQAVVAAAVTQAAPAATQAGFKAGTDRAVAVMSSDQGKAHLATALSFLANEKLAGLSAEEMIASLPAAAAPAAVVPAAEEPAGERPAGAAAAQERLAAAPKVALGNQPTKDGLNEDAKGTVSKEAAVNVWKGVQGKKGDTTIQPAGAR